MAEVQGNVTPENTVTGTVNPVQPDDSTAKNLSAQRKMYQAEIKERDAIITELSTKILSVSEQTAQTIKAKEDEFNAKLSEITQEKQSLLSYKEKFEAIDTQFDAEATKELEELKTSLGEEKFGEFSKVVSLE
jgi:small-conductance mechanosensitive channel